MSRTPFQRSVDGAFCLLGDALLTEVGPWRQSMGILYEIWDRPITHKVWLPIHQLAFWGWFLPQEPNEELNRFAAKALEIADRLEVEKILTTPSPD